MAEKKQVYEKKNEELCSNFKQYMIARLEYKIMILVLSLLEKRHIEKNDIILDRIQSSLSKDILEQKMTLIYMNIKKLYQKEYVIDCFLHVIKNFLIIQYKQFEGEPKEKKSKNDKENLKFETITETGFFIFFLLCNYERSNYISDPSKSKK